MSCWQHNICLNSQCGKAMSCSERWSMRNRSWRRCPIRPSWSRTCSRSRRRTSFFLRLLEVPSLDTLLPHQRNMIYFLFRPLIRMHSSMNAEARAGWQKQVLYGIQLFKQNNVLYQYEPWYQELVQQWCAIEGFRQYWEMARENAGQEDAPPSKPFLACMPTTGELVPIRTQSMLISVSSKIYPAVMAMLPVDEGGAGGVCLVRKCDRTDGERLRWGCCILLFDRWIRPSTPGCKRIDSNKLKICPTQIGSLR